MDTISPETLGSVRLLLVVIVSAAAILLALDNWPSMADQRERLKRDHALGAHKQIKAWGCPDCYH